MIQLTKTERPVVRNPEAYIHFTPGLVTDEGEVTVESTAKFLEAYVLAFHAFIVRVTTVLPRESLNP